MKHLFTLIAAISLLICLLLVGLTAMTMNGSKTMSLGQRGDRDYSLVSDSLEFVYQGKLENFDTSEHKSLAGIDYLREFPKKSSASQTPGFVLVVPALYPIALFAILPIVWLLGAMRKKKPAAETAAAGEVPPGNRA